jgi:L-Ala-D/L-Glu epimerase
MKIKLLDFYLFSIPVNFEIAKIKILFSNHIIVKLEYQNKMGIGEGVLYKTSPVKVLGLLKSQILEFFKQDFISLKQARNKLNKVFTVDNPGTVCAFDMALWDLQGKIEDKPLYELFHSDKAKKVSVIEQIFIPEKKKQLEKELEKIINNKTKTIKLKGGRNLQHDIENINLINKIGLNKLNIQLDLNKSLDFKTACDFGREVKKLGVEVWEEPIKFKQLVELKQLRKKTGIKIILDESIQNLNSLNKAIRNKALDILNIKLSRLGGITGSLDYIKLADKNNIKIEIGCSEELGIGTSSQWQLAQTVSNLNGLEALGPNRLGFDVIKQNWQIKNAKLFIKIIKPGLGVDFNLLRLKKEARKKNFIVLHKNSSLAERQKFYLDWFILRTKSKINNGLIRINKILS